jgi:histone-lysine N-methyltransferase SETMAR
MHHELASVPDMQPPSERAVREWTARFKQGRQTVRDDLRSGPPTSSVTNEIICAVEKFILEDPCASVDEIAEHICISHGSVHEIVTHHLRMKKICARWVPHALTPVQKEERMEMAQSLLNKFRRWGKEGMKLIVTGDETCVHCYNPGHRQQRMEWVPEEGAPPTAPRPDRFMDKTLYTIFFTTEGLLAKILSPEGGTISGQYYRGVVLPAVLSAFHKIHPHATPRLHHDKTPWRRCQTVCDFISSRNVQ